MQLLLKKIYFMSLVCLVVSQGSIFAAKKQIYNDTENPIVVWVIYQNGIQEQNIVPFNNSATVDDTKVAKVAIAWLSDMQNPVEIVSKEQLQGARSVRFGMICNDDLICGFKARMMK
jgi:hypothetical protein